MQTGVVRRSAGARCGFVRLMTDRGFNFVGHDRHSHHLFSPDRQVSTLKGRYDLVTAFEVVEHFADPREGFGRLAAHAENILLTTQLVPSPTPRLQDWWYDAPEHGQHIAFYSVESMRRIASDPGLHFYTSSSTRHNITFPLMSRVPRDERVFRALA